MHKTKSLARFVRVPENRPGLVAVQDLVASLLWQQASPPVHPVVVHGPPGTGKTHLVLGLIREATRRATDIVVSLLAAADLDTLHDGMLERNGQSEDGDLLEAARGNDLLIVEDIQHLSRRGAETLVQILDHRQSRCRATLLSSRTPPQELGASLGARLTSRLAAGLVVAIPPLSPGSRRSLLEDFAERRQLAVSPDVLAWLAVNLPGGGRVLESAVRQLDSLVRQSGRSPDLGTVTSLFAEQVNASRPTLERIVQRVGGYYRVEPRQLQSRHRYRNAMRPRQVGMYLARRLTALSLEQIGAYFGGRDHTTVLHACRKIEQALVDDELLSGTVRQLQADLS